MYEELFCGLGADLRATIVPMSHDRHQEMVLIKDIDFFSVCEHHLVPFSGKAHDAYIPSENGHITRLSGLARLVRVAAARPQLQERITSEVADALQEALRPLGTFVLIEAEHLCMSMPPFMPPTNTFFRSQPHAPAGPAFPLVAQTTLL